MGENLQPSGTSSVFEGEDGTLFFDAFEFDFLEDEDGDGIPFFDTVQFVEDLVEYDDDIEEVIDTEIINLDPPHIVPDLVEYADDIEEVIDTEIIILTHPILYLDGRESLGALCNVLLSLVLAAVGSMRHMLWRSPMKSQPINRKGERLLVPLSGILSTLR